MDNVKATSFAPRALAPLAILLALLAALVSPTMLQSAWADDTTWEPADFTYAIRNQDEDAVQPTTGGGAKQKNDIWVITGFSESGEAKFETNKNVVFPAVDPDGKKVQGIGKAAFKGKGIESIVLPEVEVNDESKVWGADMADRGYFFICYEAFRNNNLQSLTIPEGVLHIATYSFAGNKQLQTVTFPSTLFGLNSGAFYQDAKLKHVNFPEETTYPIELGDMAFMGCAIESVQLSKNFGAAETKSFALCTGMEPTTGGSATWEKNSGVVYLYVPDKSTLPYAGAIAHDANTGKKTLVARLIESEIPGEYTPWNAADFTYDGATVTGLTEVGKKKMKLNSIMVIPDQNADGVATTAIGPGVSNTQGTFAFTEGETTYEPTAVTFPAGLTKIDKWAFASTQMTSIDFPATLTEIGQLAFAYSKLTAVDLSGTQLATLGNSAFLQSQDITSVKLPATLEKISDAAFAKNPQGAAETPIDEVVIAEGVTTIGRATFSGSLVKKVTLPSTLTSIGTNAFTNHALTELEIPAGVKQIPSSSFSQASTTPTLETLVLNEGLEQIGINAFNNAKIATVAIPTTLTTLNANAFNANNNPDREDKKAVLISTKYDQIKKTGNYTKVENNGTGNNGGGHIVVGDLSAASMAAVEDQDATGSAVTPEPAITFDGQALTKDADYTLSYEANIEPGTSKITATGKGDAGTFVNTLEGNFNIVAVSTEWTADCFTYSEDGATVTGLTDLGKKVLKANPDMVIPDANAAGVTTTAIGPGAAGKGTFTFTEDGEGSAFERTYTPTTVKLPAALEEIGNFAFCAATETTASPWQVKGLTTVDFPDTLKKIGNIAFQNAPLDKIVLPDSVTELGTGVFTGNEKIAAPKLSALTISKGLKVIPDGTFTTRQIDAIVVPEGVETIGRNAFNGSLATSVSLPSTLKTIGRQAFCNHHFESVVIPAGVETIDQTAFRIVVGDFAGSGHTITSLELNEGLKAIGKNAFQDACALETLPIPTTLTTLDSTAFSGNNNPNRTDKRVVLTTLIQDQATAAGDYTKVVADGAGHIIEFTEPTWTPECFTYDGATVTGLTDLGKKVLRAKDGALEIPNANADNVPTTIIGAGTPSTASKTQAGTFGYKDVDGTWVYPKTVKFPEGLTEIGKFAFSGVYLTGTDPETGKATEEIVGGLTEVTLPNTLTTIGQAAFNWAQLTKVEIPDSVTSLGNGAFATAMTLPGTITEATLPANIETIPDSLFNNQELTAIEIPASVKTIQRNAFRENPIKNLTIPENVETIGNCAFQNHALTELVIPASVKTIGNEAFNVSGHDGGALASLTLNEGLESIGTRAFQGASLKEVEIPASLKTLKTYAFNNNKNEDREDSRVVLKSKVYAQAKGTGDYAKFVPDETFTTHHGGGHLTVLDFTSDQVTVGEIEDIVCFEEGEVKPEITVTWTDPDKTENTLVAETDYTVAFEGNTAEGEAKATITGAGPFVGEQTATFTIAGHDWDEGKFKGEGAKGEIVYTCKHNAEHTKSEPVEDLVVKDGEQAMWIAGKSADISAIASGLADGEVITKWTWEYSRDGKAWSKSGAKTFAGDGECTMVIPECTTARKPPMAWRATATTSLGRTATSAGQKLHVLEDLKVVPDPEGDFTWALDKDVVISAKVQGLAPNETVDTYTWYYSRDGKTFKRTGAKSALVGTDTLTLSGFKCTEARKAPMAWSVKVTTSTGRTYTSEGMSLTETA